MTANPILLQKKYSRVIECFAKQQGLSLDAALDFFYHSQVYQLIRDGVSDMHCMSDAYLAEELEQEYEEKTVGYVSDTIQSVSTGERVKLNKKLTTLQVQDTEIRTYEEKKGHKFFIKN